MTTTAIGARCHSIISLLIDFNERDQVFIGNQREQLQKEPAQVPSCHNRSGWGGCSLGVLIASCTANLNVHQISYWQTRTAAQTRCARNNHTNLNPRYKNSPPAGAPVNKTQPKAPLPQEGFGMNSEIMLFFANRFLCCWTEGTQEIAAGSWAALRRKTSGSFHGKTRLS